MTLLSPSASAPTVNRYLIIAGSVILFHMAALWALQFGLRSRPIEVIVPAEILVEWVAPAAPAAAPPAPAPMPVPAKPTPVKQVEKKIAAPAKVTAPMPLAIADPTPAPTAPAGVREVPMATAPQEVSVPAAGNRVFIGVDGTAQKTEIKQSSGFDRLDQAALATVLRWRYVPGKRAGVPEAMWFNVPISFVLE